MEKINPGDWSFVKEISIIISQSAFAAILENMSLKLTCEE